MKVRLATEADIPEVVRMGRMFWAQTSFSHIAYCPDSIAKAARDMMGIGLLLMAEVDGKIAGSVGAVVCPLYANRDVLLGSELFWWVEPEYRNTGIGKEMILGIEKAAKEAGVTIFSMMALETVEPDKAAAIYKRFGYLPTERGFSKVLI